MRSEFVLVFPSRHWVTLTKALPLSRLPHLKKKELNQMFVKRPSMLHDPEESYHHSRLPDARVTAGCLLP